MYRKIRETKCYRGKGTKSLWRSDIAPIYLLIKTSDIMVTVTPFYKRNRKETLYFGKEFINVLSKYI